MQVFLLILILIVLYTIINQPKCPKCKSQTVVMYSNELKCTKCGYTGEE